MRKLDPACKLIGLLIPTILLLFYYSPVLNLLIFLLGLIVCLLSKCSKKALLTALFPILLSALALYFTALRFPSDSHLALSYALFEGSAVWNALQLATRVPAFAGPGLVFALTTDRVGLIRSVRQRFRFPAKFAYGLLAAVGVLPNILHEYRKARMAFRARGLSPAPWSAALLKPLLVKTVRWSEALAAAMESKGFGGGTRTEYYETPLRARDICFPLLTTAMFFFAVWLSNGVLLENFW